MNILKRPGWLHYDLINEAGEGSRYVRPDAFTRQIGKMHAAGDLPSAKFMQSPQVEVYRFVGQIILNDDELRDAFPPFKNARDLKSRHFGEASPEALERLKGLLDEYYSDESKFKEILSQLHASRRARSSEELATQGIADTREKHTKWKRRLGIDEPTAEDETGESTPGEVGELSPESEARVKAGQFQINFLPIFFNIPVQGADDEYLNVRDLDDSVVNALWNSVSNAKDIFEVLENLSDLAVSDEGEVGSYANEIFEVLKSELVRGADEVVDQAETNPGVPAHLADYFKDFKAQKAEHAKKYSAPQGRVMFKHGAKNVESENVGDVDEEFKDVETVGKAADAWLRAREEEGSLSPELSLSPEEQAEIRKNVEKNFQRRKDKFPESTKLTAKQVDQVLLEQRRRAAQYRAIMEERYGR